MGMLAIIGSGETSPTMVTVHRRLAGLIPAPRRAVLLETPYLFQTNASSVSAKAQAYFARSVGLKVNALPGVGSDADVAAIRSADWVFVGPGSPSYALRHWRDAPIGHALRDRIHGRAGITVLASAAAATIGCAAVPVYELYKAGEAPHWLDGLDLLGALGLRAAVVPHFDNTEGGTYDTRFCYLGESRLVVMEKLLGDGVSVLGVDEHTALLIDLRTEECEVTGRGGVTVRRDGVASVLPAGTTVALAELRSPAMNRRHQRPGHARHLEYRPRPEPAEPTLREAVAAAESAYAAATGRDGRVAAVLALEQAIHEWAADTDEDDGVAQARAALRGLILRLAEPDGLPAALVDGLLAVREALRETAGYATADAIRELLAAEGVRINDTAHGSGWTRPESGGLYLPGVTSIDTSAPSSMNDPSGT